MLGDALKDWGSLLAVPLYDRGEPLNWAIMLRRDPDGFTIDYQYNAMNQLSAVPGFVANVDYIATGQKSEFIYENGIQNWYTGAGQFKP